MFLLLLNLFKKIKIIKEKNLFKQKTINCKYYNLTGIKKMKKVKIKKNIIILNLL